MPFYLFTWTDEIIAHLAENGVESEEFEFVVCNPQFVDTSRASGRPISIGRSCDGRTLVCVYELLDDVTVLPVTAFEPEAE
jgi:hypothetical protein